MAAALRVNLRTIKRWEAAEPPNINPFMKFVWLSVSRYAVRLYRYGKAVLPASYLNEVRASPFERSVYIGPEAVVLAMSDETRRTWGVFRHAEGLSVSAFSSKPERALLAEHYSVMKEICSAGDQTRLVHFVTSEAPLGSTPPLWRLHVMQARFPEIFDMMSVPITEGDYAAANPKLWISQTDRGSVEESQILESIRSFRPDISLVDRNRA